MGMGMGKLKFKWVFAFVKQGVKACQDSVKSTKHQLLTDGQTPGFQVYLNSSRANAFSPDIWHCKELAKMCTHKRVWPLLSGEEFDTTVAQNYYGTINTTQVNSCNDAWCWVYQIWVKLERAKSQVLYRGWVPWERGGVGCHGYWGFSFIRRSQMWTFGMWGRTLSFLAELYFKSSSEVNISIFPVNGITDDRIFFGSCAKILIFLSKRNIRKGRFKAVMQKYSQEMAENYCFWEVVQKY